MRLILLVLVLLIPGICVAEEPSGVAELFALHGTAEIRGNPTAEWKPLTLGAKLKEGEEVRVLENSRAAIQFPSGYLIRLSGNSHIRVHSSEGAVDLDSGLMHFFNRSSTSGATVRTPVVSAAIRGTEGTVSVGPKETQFNLFEGYAELSNQFGSLSLTNNQSANTKAGEAPKRSLFVSRTDSIQWAVFIPELGQSGDRDEKQGSLQAAGNSLKLLTQGKPEEALDILRTAAHTPSTTLARSYVLQSKGELESVKEIIDEGLKLYPQNQNLLARAAEIALYEGDISSAKAFIESGCGVSCASPHLNVIQGFIRLLSNETDAAVRIFSAVIQSNSEISMAYLGRSLALLQSGEAEEAQADLLRAVALDPTVSIYRSYLGKMFYETYNEGKASNEYKEAITLDANDPTPYLYRAYLKLSENDPLGAVEDVEESISRNGNRAVFRSSLLLDQDEAVRSAALSRIFIESGFTDAARIEAIHTIIKDPLNYSAHRLLGETQDGIFYADAALSELKIARILAPANSNLNQTAGSQLSLNSFDSLFERNFTRTGVGYAYDGRSDSHNPSLANVGRHGSVAWGVSAASSIGDGFKRNNFSRDTLVGGGVDYDLNWDKKLRLESSGRFITLRDTNSSDEDIDSTSGGASLSYVQRQDAGEAFIADVGINRIREDVYSPEAERTVILTQILGGESVDDLDSLILNQRLHSTANLFHTALQYTVTERNYSLTVGSQFLHQQPEKTEESLILEDSEGLFVGAESSVLTGSHTEISGHDAYAYTTVSPSRYLDLTFGMVRTDIESEVTEIPPYIDETRHEGRFNPKLGIHSRLTNALSVRASYTESLRKSSLEDQESLEPTLVGGLTQRFNDLTGSVARAAGVGIDWKAAGYTYLGAEYTRRRVTEDLRTVIDNLEIDLDEGTGNYSLITQEADLTHRLQHLGRAYLHQRLCRSLSASLEYRHSSNNGDDPESTDSIGDDTLSASLNWFDRSGIFASIRESWLRQDRELRAPFPDGIESVWLTDAVIGWRIPKRQGKLFLQARNLFNSSFDLDQTEGFREDIKNETSYIAGFEYNF